MKQILFAFLLFSFLSSYAQSDDCFLMPYRKGDKWGLCDTLGNIKVKPVYDDFVDMIIDEYSRQSFYFVKKNGRTTVIDHKNVQQLTEYDSVDPASGLIYKGGKTGMYIYREGNGYYKTAGSFQIIAEPLYDSIEVVSSYHLYMLNKNGRKGLLFMDHQQYPSIVLKPEYDDIVFEKPFYKGYKNGIVTASYKDPIYSVEGDLDASPDKQQRKLIEKQQQKKDKEYREKFIENLTRDASPEDLKSILPFEITPINKYVKYRKDNKQGYAGFSYTMSDKIKVLIKHMVIPAVYDSISEAGTSTYLIKKDGKYGFYTGGKEIVEPIYDEVKFGRINANEILLKKDRKYAVYNVPKKMLVTGFEFDGYEFIQTNKDTYYTILHKGKKKMLLYNSSVGDEYDDLLPDYKLFTPPNDMEYQYDYVKCNKEGKYGVIVGGKINVPAIFDDVILEDKDFFTTINRGMKGASIDNGKINIPPHYKSVKTFKIITNSKRSYFLYKVIDKDKVVFYTDCQGKEFYHK